MSTEAAFFGFLILCPMALFAFGVMCGCIYCSRSSKEDDE